MISGWVQLIVGLIVLVIGGEFLVRTSVKLALYLRISSLVIGLTVVSFGTSFPELVVSVNAALDGHPDIAIGNVVGSNIANLALVLGLACMIFPLNVKRATVMMDWPLMLLSTLALIAFSWDLRIQLWEGLTLFAGIIAYNVFVIRASRKQMRRISSDAGVSKDFRRSNRDLIKTLGLFLISLAGLLIGADLLVDGAVIVALSFGIEERIIALSIVAFGTSVPELATSIIALNKDESSMSVGNLIGSNIFNILGIMGVTAIIHPVDVHPTIQSFDFYWLLGIPLVLFPFLLTRRKVSRGEGIILFLSYIVYMFMLFSTK